MKGENFWEKWQWVPPRLWQRLLLVWLGQRKTSEPTVSHRGRKGLPPPAQARGGNHFPNVRVFSHTGKEFKLYDDLIRDKVVVLNFMSIKEHLTFPVSTHMAKIAKSLGDKLGKKVFMYSITIDPKNDTAGHLRRFAEKNEIRYPGWHFLTTSVKNVNQLSDRLYKHGCSPSSSPGSSAAHGHPTRLVHYGNGGNWTMGGIRRRL